MILKKFFRLFLKKVRKVEKTLDSGLEIVLYGRPSTLKRGQVKEKV